ncbi:hypothetical protein ACVIN2_005606 [Bradyrhizobium sp. USDA 3650]
MIAISAIAIGGNQEARTTDSLQPSYLGLLPNSDCFSYANATSNGLAPSSPSCPQVHVAGEKLFVDYSGQAMELG